MTKSKPSKLLAQCSKCNHAWNPYGNRRLDLPAIADLICPKCDTKMNKYTWPDIEFEKEIVRKKLNLIDSSNIINKINALEDKIGLLRSHLELEQTKNKVLENRLNQIENWKNIREEDFQDIEQISKDLRDDEQFREDNK